MKTFREHLNEEVKIGALSSGGIDIERDAVRDEINLILAGIASRPCVTPYSSLNKVRKALSYFSIFLPKKVYLEGKHGIEVWEVKQFGDKIGFTDSGEWITNVPCKYYLFFHYHMVGSMYYLKAKIVDEKELETKISSAESMVAEENAEMMKHLQKAIAPKEKMHSALGDCDCSQGDSPSTKKAINVSMKKMEEEKKIKIKLNPEKKIGYTVHDVGPGGKKTLVKSGETKVKDMKEDKDPCWKGYEMVGMKKKGARKVPNCVPVKEEKSFNEMTPSEKLQWMKDQVQKGKDEKKRLRKSLREKPKKNIKEEQIDEVSMSSDQKKEHLRSYLASLKRVKRKGLKHPRTGQTVKGRHIATVQSGISKRTMIDVSKLEETQIDELKKTTLGSYIKKASVDLYGKGASRAFEVSRGKIDPDTPTAKKSGKRIAGIYRATEKLTKEEALDEKLTKSMSAGDVISDFVHSDDPKFKGKSKKERQKMAFGAYYGMHPEKSKKRLDELHGKGKLGDIISASYKKMRSHPLGHGHPENPHIHDVHRGNELVRIVKDDEWYKKHGGRGFKRGIGGYSQSQLHRGAKKEFLAKHGAGDSKEK